MGHHFQLQTGLYLLLQQLMHSEALGHICDCAVAEMNRVSLFLLTLAGMLLFLHAGESLCSS